MTMLADFKIFLILWNRMQGHGTPGIHFRMADALESAWDNSDRRILLQAFRSSGKSTLAGIFTAWLLYRNPDLRIIVLAADSILARKMVRNVRKIIERHPLTPHLRPQHADQWASDRFTVNRNLELRDPSMLARGIDSNMTGSRADIIICDDVEVPNTCDTAGKRADLREKLAEIDFVLVPGGMVLYLGTPHTWRTIYADIPRVELGEDKSFLDGYHRITIPIIGADGQSAWPERFTLDDIDRMKRAAGPNRFASQMMLIPVNIAEGRLNPALLRFYNADLHKSVELGGLYLDGRKLVSCSAWWDPAFGNGGDSSVLAVVYADDQGNYYLHRIEYIAIHANNNEDEATLQCCRVAQIARDLFIPAVTIETNGIGKFLPAILRREMALMRVSCTVNETTSTRPKHLRILEAIDAVLAARMLHAHETVRHTPLMTEMQEWRPDKNGGRDDGLDAVAGALSLQPVRLKFERFGGRQNWQTGGKPHTASTDFEV